MSGSSDNTIRAKTGNVVLGHGTADAIKSYRKALELAGNDGFERTEKGA